MVCATPRLQSVDYNIHKKEYLLREPTHRWSEILTNVAKYASDTAACTVSRCSDGEHSTAYVVHVDSLVFVECIMKEKETAQL